MTYRSIKLHVGSGLLILALVLTSGCATLNPGTPEEIVARRAQAWADALVAGNIKEAFAFTSPGYREFSDWGRYHARVEGAARWETATVKEVNCVTESVCEVKLILEYRVVTMNVDVRRPRSYRWVKSEGNWWLYVAPN